MLAGLWLASEVVNHVGIYGSKAVESFLASQRRSCLQFVPSGMSLPEKNHWFKQMWLGAIRQQATVNEQMVAKLLDQI